MNFPTITRYNWMCCSIILVFLALSSPKPLQAQENQKERITIQVKNQPIQKVFDDLSKQTGLKFFYGEAIANRNVQVNLKFKNAPINSVLNEITRQANLYFKRENNTIAVSLGNAGNASVPVTQDRKVTGIITDERGEPIIGANVVVKGTSKGTVTDLNGEYSIEANGKSILLISYIGYLSEEVAVGNNKTLNIQLKEDAQKLDEVVVIGYGTQKRSNLSGAISKVTSEVIESKPVTNVLSALQGEIPGMVIQRSSGQPGNEDFKMNIRGVSSANGDSAPLVLVDGIPGDINMINPQDIDAISVLKDASASIYGARAAGGVVLITTKKGATGAPKITYNGNLSISKMTGMMKAPTNYEMAIMDNEANIHNGSAPMYTQELLDRILSNDPNPIDHPLYGGWKLFFTNTDWMDELLNNGVQHKHNLTISGGGEKSNYYLSAGYSKQFGVVKYADDNNTKYNLRMNYDYRITDWLKLETKVALDNNKRTDVGSNGAWVIGEAILDMPNHPVYNADGNFFTQGGWSNAVALAKESETATFKTREMNGNFRLIANIIDGLTLTAKPVLIIRTRTMRT
jgi:TonB-linked SusC/RagA family outer membrane protein